MPRHARHIFPHFFIVYSLPLVNRAYILETKQRTLLLWLPPSHKRSNYLSLYRALYILFLLSISKYILIYLNISISLSLSISIFPSIYFYFCIYIYIFIYIYFCIYMSIYIYIHIFIYIELYIYWSPSLALSVPFFFSLSKRMAFLAALMDEWPFSLSGPDGSRGTANRRPRHLEP